MPTQVRRNWNGQGQVSSTRQPSWTGQLNSGSRVHFSLNVLDIQPWLIKRCNSTNQCANYCYSGMKQGHFDDLPTMLSEGLDCMCLVLLDPIGKCVFHELGPNLAHKMGNFLILLTAKPAKLYICLHASLDDSNPRTLTEHQVVCRGAETPKPWTGGTKKISLLPAATKF